MSKKTVGVLVVLACQPTPYRHRLPRGRHVITFTANDGTSATTTFEVSAETSSPDPVVEVRAPFE